jgi:hypothetical protein
MMLDSEAQPVGDILRQLDPISGRRHQGRCDGLDPRPAYGRNRACRHDPGDRHLDHHRAGGGSAGGGGGLDRRRGVEQLEQRQRAEPGRKPSPRVRASGRID